MSILLAVVLLGVGLLFLIKGSDFLVKHASIVARRLGVSTMVIGLTIVALGTSLPEFIISLTSYFTGNASLSLGNLVGTNIVNVLLILGLSATIFPLAMRKNTAFFDLPFALITQIMLIFLTSDVWLGGASENMISRGDGLIMLAIGGLYFYYVLYNAHDPNCETSTGKLCQIMAENCQEMTNQETRLACQKTYIKNCKTKKKRKSKKDLIKQKAQRRQLIKSLMIVLLSIGVLILGAFGVTEGASMIAAFLGVSQEFIGLTIVSVGTSLPELFIGITSAIKKTPDMIVGNIVGSSIFNILLILGFSSILSPITISANMSYVLAINLATLTLFLFFTLRNRRKSFQIGRGEGIIFLLGYVAFMAVTIINR